MMLLPRRILLSLLPLIVAALAAVAITVGFLGSAGFGILVVVSGVVGLQWLAAPWVIAKLTGARPIPHDGVRYLTTPGSVDDRVGKIVSRRCADAGLPLVCLGIVDDETPNAFTFGRTTKSSHVVVTTGLVDRLGDDELDAVVCHELGHVKHRDALVMTAIVVVPILLSLTARVLVESSDDADGDDDEGGLALFGLGLYLLYLLSELMILALSRSREYAADHWSCECTGNGDALASALVMVTRAAREVKEGRSRVVENSGMVDPKADRRRAKKDRRFASLNTLGLMHLRSSESVTEPLGSSEDDVRRRLSNDLRSRRLRIAEFFSTHPTVARRIVALEQSGLIGAPSRWSLSLGNSEPKRIARTFTIRRRDVRPTIRKDLRDEERMPDVTR